MRNQKTLISTMLALAGLSLWACAHHEETARSVPTASGSQTTGDRTGTMNEMPELTDGQIAAIIDTANRGAIAMGELAKTNATSPDVRSFANNIVTDDSAINNDLMAILQKQSIATGDSDKNKDLMSMTNDSLKKMRDAKGSDFDKTFVSASIDLSKKVLDLIDNKLMPNVRNPDIAQKIRDLRPHVAKHLMDAQQLQATVPNVG
jgi:putative membrane protein